MEIDWENPDCKVTEHFTVRDCLWLGKLKRMANEDDGLTLEIKLTLVETCKTAELVRLTLGVPMTVTSIFRPKHYAALVGSSHRSPHCSGLAIDFTTEPHMRIEEAKGLIRPILDLYKLRMEKGTTTWIHIDRRPPGISGREFIP